MAGTPALAPRLTTWLLVLLLACCASGAAAIQASRTARMGPRSGGSGSGGASGRRYSVRAEEDRVEGLPGAPEPQGFGMFAGNVTVDEAAGRALFYVFVERVHSPETAPVILWLNGGPGCSSLGGGFMSELGPYFPHQQGNALKSNPYAWNNGLANIIFLESPAFVGFSFSKRPSDAIVGDARTAADARLFLLGWLERFPQYAESDIFISGESYGGHYVPNLALEIVKGNRLAAARGDGGGSINLRGFLVGNAWTDPAIDNEGTLDFWYTHALVSDEAYHGIRRHCNFSNIGPLMRGKEALALGRAAGRRPGLAPVAAPGGGPAGGADISAGRLERLQATSDASCEEFVEQAFWEIQGINIYDIYADTCNPDPPPAPPASADGANAARTPPPVGRYRGALLGLERAAAATATTSAAAGAGTAPSAPRSRRTLPGPADVAAGGGDARYGYPHPGRVPRYDPCIDNKVEVYMNKPEVQSALHANQSGALPGPWQDCSQAIAYSRDDLLGSMIPVYKELLRDANLVIWVFSGDVDGIVPVLGSRRWIKSLGLPVDTPWRAWQSQTGQIGGWRVDYEGLSFVTVRNAGHMVPYVQPERGYHLVADFLDAASQPPPSRRRSS